MTNLAYTTAIAGALTTALMTVSPLAAQTAPATDAAPAATTQAATPAAAPATAAATASDQPLASGMVAGGFRADLVHAARNGDVLTAKVRYMNVGAKNGAPLYDGITDEVYNQQIYLVAGGKKYLLLKDAAGTPLAPAKLALSDIKGDVAGIWHGDFPAPPADVTSAMLYISGTEPLGPFEIK